MTVEELLCSQGFCHWNTLIVRRALYEEVGGLDERNGWEHDRDLYLRLIDRAAVVKYAPITVARHNVPDPTKEANLTTAHSDFERHLSQLRLLDRARSAVGMPPSARARPSAQGIYAEADCRSPCRCRPERRGGVLCSRSPWCRPYRQVGRLHRVTHAEAGARWGLPCRLLIRLEEIDELITSTAIAAHPEAFGEGLLIPLRMHARGSRSQRYFQDLNRYGIAVKTENTGIPSCRLTPTRQGPRYRPGIPRPSACPASMSNADRDWLSADPAPVRTRS